jgi:hypothetical protein
MAQWTPAALDSRTLSFLLLSVDLLEACSTQGRDMNQSGLNLAVVILAPVVARDVALSMEIEVHALLIQLSADLLS